MPCHKQAIYIRDALRSVFRQSYASWDLIVVDDRSPDRCGRVAVREVRSRFRDYEETSERRNTRLMPEDFLVRHMDLTVTSFRGAQGRTIQVVENHDNCGLSCSRNLAILLTDAPYILTLDADDLIHQSYLRIAVSALQTNPALGIVTGATQQFFGASNWTWWLPEWSPRAVLDRGPFPVATVYRRADWARIGGYNPLLPWGNEDWTFWIALSWLPGMQVHKLKGEYWPGKGMGKGESTSSYRYKAASMARSKEEHAEECEAMMRTIHSALYGPERTLEAHSLLLTRGSLQMRELVEAAVARAGTGKALGRQSEAALWLGLWWEGRAEEDGEGGLKAEALREARDCSGGEPG
ncbi:nucleotide-diphospho-sugar transferase [Hyaloraphidium curvatum]|nr:nucleotide-diphospho-sugar transferase [Hyaloraphidium curvatum]